MLTHVVQKYTRKKRDIYLVLRTCRYLVIVIVIVILRKPSMTPCISGPFHKNDAKKLQFFCICDKPQKSSIL